MTVTWITWNIGSGDMPGAPNFERKVEIFYERTYGWQLHIADMLANGGQTLDGTGSVPPVRHSGFAVLHICLSYFETIGHYEQGLEGKYAFKVGVRSVFPKLLANYYGSRTRSSTDFMSEPAVGCITTP